MTAEQFEMDGWQWCARTGSWSKEYQFGNHDSAVLRICRTVAELEPWQLSSNAYAFAVFETLELAVNAANALACVTPDNPVGRWVK